MVQPWDKVVLGNIFLTNFVTTWKLNEDIIDLRQNVNAGANVQLKVTKNDDDELSGLAIGLISGGCALAVIIAVVVGILCYKKSKAKGQDRVDGDQNDNEGLLH